MGSKHEWQPIETAPRDGTRVLVWVPKYAEHFVAALMTCPDDGDQQWIVARFHEPKISVIAPSPTHWMPLPEPPPDKRSDYRDAVEATETEPGNE